MIKGVVAGSIVVCIVLTVMTLRLRTSVPIPSQTSQQAGDFILPAPATPVATGDVSVAYDKFKDETSVSVGELVPGSDADRQKSSLLVADGSGGYISPKWRDVACVQVSYEFKGRTVTHIVRGLRFMFIGGGINAADSVIFLVDGQKRVRFAETPAKPSGAYGFVRVADAIAIAKAKSVEIQIGSTSYKMRSEQQQAVMQMLEQVGVK